MNYILLDLEWDSAYFTKIHGFINEIVEFGAVKLSEDFNEIDRFNIIVRSSLTKKLSGRFKDLTGMTNEEMLSGVPFDEGLKMYKNWAGNDTITLTWSDSDLYVLYDNCMYFTSSENNAQIGKYADLQKFFHAELAFFGKGEKNQLSLANAAKLIDVNIEEKTLHHAVDDSAISAEILKKCYNSARFPQFVHNTDNPDFYPRLRYKAHFITDINNPLIDKRKLSVDCPVCQNKAKRTSNWNSKGRWFVANYSCKECKKKYKGFVSFKKHYDRIDINTKAMTFEEIKKFKAERKKAKEEKETLKSSQNIKGTATAK